MALIQEHDELLQEKDDLQVFHNYFEPPMSPDFLPSYKRVEPRYDCDHTFPPPTLFHTLLSLYTVSVALQSHHTPWPSYLRARSYTARFSTLSRDHLCAALVTINVFVPRTQRTPGHIGDGVGCQTVPHQLQGAVLQGWTRRGTTAFMD